MLLTAILCFLFSTSFSLNVILLIQRQRKPEKPPSQELQEFLADLMGGLGIVAVSRIDPNGILLRSPKS